LLRRNQIILALNGNDERCETRLPPVIVPLDQQGD
jgi:hypothetical protein